MDDFTRAHLTRIFIVAPFAWFYYHFTNPIKLFWHHCLPEQFREWVRATLGWPTWAEYHRQQEELRRKYDN